MIPSRSTASDSPTPISPVAAHAQGRRLLIVDDHPGFRRGIVSMISAEPDIMVCGEADAAPAALDAMRRLNPDAAVLDISMPGANGIELIKMMLAERPKLPILILSMHEESVYALRALKAGARGYVMKSEALDSIRIAIRAVLNNEIYVSSKLSQRLIFKAIQSDEAGLGSPVDHLSDRELEVFQLLGKGFGTREIAAELHLSTKTIETHRAHIKEKLGFQESGEMVRFAVDWAAQEQS